MAIADHWEQVYLTKNTEEVSWFQSHASRSLKLIRACASPSEAVIDVGGGASKLIDDLLASGFTDLSVLDISGTALDLTKQRLGDKASRVNWYESSVTTADLAKEAYDVWHDRAVFHFLVSPSDRQRYIQKMQQSLRADGWVVMATFADDGPEKCSGLPVMRYTASTLTETLGEGFKLVKHEKEQHQTPGGSIQSFLYCLFQKKYTNYFLE